MNELRQLWRLWADVHTRKIPWHQQLARLGVFFCFLIAGILAGDGAPWWIPLLLSIKGFFFLDWATK